MKLLLKLSLSLVLAISCFADAIVRNNDLFLWESPSAELVYSDGWSVGKTTKAGYPTLQYRLAEGQVLMVSFVNDDEPSPPEELAKQYLAEMENIANFRLTKPLKKVAMPGERDAYYFECERDRNGVRYRQGVFVMNGAARPIVGLSGMEASQDAKAMDLALSLLLSIKIRN